VRKKLSSAVGLVTIATAGALIASTPAYATEDIASITPAVAGPASATVGQQSTVSTSARTLPNDDGWRRRHRHRRHRFHRRHRHHRHHYRHHRRHWY
jgi:hypothetical protein